MNKIMQLYRDNAAREKTPVNLVTNANEASLYIYDVIDSDWGVGALQVAEAIKNVGNADTLNVYINSPGGSVFEGRAIMAEIQRFQGKTIAHIDSLCASAATSIAISCDEVVMSDGAFFMIHNAAGLAWGDKNVMRETADLLEKIEGSIVADYVNKTGKDAAEIIDMMNVETWMTAQEALDHGFIDRIIPAKTTDNRVKNAWNLAAYEKAPQALIQPPPANQETAPNNNPDQAPAGSFMATSNANRLKLALL